MSAVIEVLRRARALLESSDSWAQTPIRAGRHDAHSAIVAAAAGDADLAFAATCRLAIAVQGPILDWNDAPDQTHGGIIDGFTQAIAKAARPDRAPKTKEPPESETCRSKRCKRAV